MNEFEEEDPGHHRAASWVALAGHWTFDGAAAMYDGPQDLNVPAGVAITDLDVRTGWVEAEITLSAVEAAGRLIFGRDSVTGAYYSAGIGGDRFAYVIDQFVPGSGWQPLFTSGINTNLEADHPYHVELYIEGQSAWLRVDDVMVLRVALPLPLGGEQVGVTAWGTQTVRFDDVRALAEVPKAFVVMQFGEPFDSIYTDVIAPVSLEMGFLAERADEFKGPGLILRDIIESILTSAVIIAEITPPNPNVFYELGYAHALGKPTILLAERDRQLPFDVSGYRVIFYDNTIAGKQNVEDALRKHLAAIVNSPS
jgi:hypothetical protein